MKHVKAVAVTLSALVLLDGCAATPMGPHVQVLPAPNKPFEVFQQDQILCKQYASDQVSGQAESANERGIGTALVGGALGAGLGAVIGGGRGAAVGAAAGGVAGTAVGAGSSQHTQLSIQQQYDNAYMQCMSAKGNQLPQAPVVVQPTIIYTTPQPVYVTPQPVYVAPQPVYAQPPVYAPPPGAAVPPPPPPQ